jgi:hypothetical protein
LWCHTGSIWSLWRLVSSHRLYPAAQWWSPASRWHLVEDWTDSWPRTIKIIELSSTKSIRILLQPHKNVVQIKHFQFDIMFNSLFIFSAKHKYKSGHNSVKCNPDLKILASSQQNPSTIRGITVSDVTLTLTMLFSLSWPWCQKQ